jgi:bla regulator protein blaR1
MNFIQGILPDRIIDAFGWTILHSLWQGLIIGILLFLFLYFYRNHNSEIRYNLSVFSLVMIFGLSVLTFIFFFKDAVQTGNVTKHGILIPDNYNGRIMTWTNSDVFSTGIISLIQSITNAISGRFPFLITLWLIGVFLISAYMTGGIYMTHKIRKSCLHIIPEELLKRFLNLISTMNIRKKVNIHGSSLIRVPSVIGFIKPVILIPLCAVTQMSMDQLEAVIAHELAHIRRHDYLVNLFQSFMEALFFYHPIVWMIQKRIREERENCCDDMALSYSKEKITYIKALASIYEMPTIPGFPVLAIGSDKFYLLTRIKRILKREKMKTNFRDKMLAGIILASAIVIILLSTGGKFISFNSMPDDTTLRDQPVQISDKSPAPEMADMIPFIPNIEPSVLPDVPNYPDINIDTSFKVKDNVIQRTIIKDGKEVDIKMKVKKGEVTELYVDGNKIPESGYGKYQPEIDKTMEDVKKLEKELTESNQKINQFEMQEIAREMEENMREIEENMKEIDVEAIVENLENIELPEIDQEKIRKEIQEAMKDIQIDKEELQREIEKSMQEIKEIDKEEFSNQLENERMKMEEEKIMVEEEKVKMNEMLEEIEKLELEEK